MPLETDPEYAHDLNILWPLEADAIGEGNEHLQNLKKVIINSIKVFKKTGGGVLPQGGVVIFEDSGAYTLPPAVSVPDGYSIVFERSQQFPDVAPVISPDATIPDKIKDATGEILTYTFGPGIADWVRLVSDGIDTWEI